jgi:hypothetical protein
MLDTLAVSRLANEPRDGGTILAQLFPKDFYGDGAVDSMLGAKNRRGSALADFALQRVAGDRLTDKILSWHAANLTAECERGKRYRSAIHFAGEDAEWCDRSRRTNSAWFPVWDGDRVAAHRRGSCLPWLLPS